MNNKEKNKIWDASMVIVIYFMLKPLYLFDSGLPQISDFFLITASGIMFIQMGGRIVMPRQYLSWIKLLLALCIYQVCINVIWFFYTLDEGMLLKSVYYFFNLIAVYTTILVGKKVSVEKLKWAVCEGAFLSILVTMFGLVMNRGIRTRAVGFFNNPNQLGYYALLMLTVVALFPAKLPKWKNAVVLLGATWATVLSLSKAAFLGIAGLAVCYTLFGQQGKSRKRLIWQAILVALICVGVYVFIFSESDIIMNNRALFSMRKRILGIASENDSSFGSGRGYDRVGEMGIHFFWGMGEGAFNRFATLTGKEVHSTYMNLFVSYGLVGFLGYCFLFLKSMMPVRYMARNIACLSAILLYFFTHNGIRNTQLWIVLGVILLTNKQRRVP